MPDQIALEKRPSICGQAQAVGKAGISVEPMSSETGRAPRDWSAVAVGYRSDSMVPPGYGTHITVALPSWHLSHKHHCVLLWSRRAMGTQTSHYVLGGQTRKWTATLREGSALCVGITSTVVENSSMCVFPHTG